MILMFCSGGSYWYKRRYLRQRIVSHQVCNVNNTMVVAVGGSNQPASSHTGAAAGKQAKI